MYIYTLKMYFHIIVIPTNLRFFCHRNNLLIKFKIFIRWFNILNFIDELFRWQKKRKLAGMH